MGTGAVVEPGVARVRVKHTGYVGTMASISIEAVE